MYKQRFESQMSGNGDLETMVPQMNGWEEKDAVSDEEKWGKDMQW